MTDPSSPPHGGRHSTWVIDRIESGVASVEVDGDRVITIPSGMLPRGAAEGDVLRVTVMQDPAERARRLARSAAQVAKGGAGGKGDIIL
jgi:DUF3006 family protein